MQERSPSPPPWVSPPPPLLLELYQQPSELGGPHPILVQEDPTRGATPLRELQEAPRPRASKGPPLKEDPPALHSMEQGPPTLDQHSNSLGTTVAPQGHPMAPLRATPRLGALPSRATQGQNAPHQREQGLASEGHRSPTPLLGSEASC